MTLHIKKHLSLLAMICLHVIWIHSQKTQYAFNKISVENGLSNNSITCIFKDTQGFIWIGTTNGLNKYDGYNFTIYKNNPSDSNSISDNFISTIVEDFSGDLWIGTQGGGLNRYDYYYDRFSTFYHDPDDKQSIGSNFIFHHNSLLIDQDTTLWIGTDNGLCSYDINKGVFNHIDFKIESKNGNEIKDVRVIFEDENNTLWIGTNAGLIQYSKSDGESQLFENDMKNSMSLSNNIITSIAKYDPGNLWVGTEEGLNLFSKQDKTFKRFFNVPGNSNTLSDNSITSIIADPTGNYWIGTKSGGLNRYRPSEKKFSHWKYDPANRSGINDNYIDYLFYDNSGLLWIATVNAGINLIDIKEKSFTLINNDPNNPNSLSYNIIRAIYEDRSGIIWIGTYGGGLNRYDGENFTHYFHNPKDSKSLSHNIVSTILEDDQGDFWIGTWGGGLNMMNRKTGEFVKVFPEIPEFINDLYEDEFHNIWIGCNGGLFIFNKSKKNITRFDNPQDIRRRLTAISVNKILRDHSGNIWISTWNGLNRIALDPSGLKPDTIIHYKKKHSDVYSLTDNRIITTFEDSRNILWIGTYAGGLNKLNLKDLDNNGNLLTDFTYYTEKDGLSGNTIYGILEDNKGYIWLSTNNGLSKFDTQKEIFLNFDVDDGLQGDQFYWRACVKSRTDRMYFGGINGLNVFHPDSIESKQVFPKVVMTDFQLFNKSVVVGKDNNGRKILDKSLIYTDKIVLARKDYAFSFEFSALTFKSQGKIKYAYKLENFDPEWIYTDSKRRYSTYSHLRPGDYTFKVKSTNKNGLWNEEYTEIELTILPAYWETIWAFAIYALIIGLLLLYLRNQILTRVRYKHSIQLERIEREKAEEYNNMKIQFFTNISHEFRTPLTLILGPLDKLISMNIPDNKIRQQLLFMHSGSKRLLKLINQILKFRKVETGNLELKVARKDIISVIKELAVSFKSHSSRNRIEYKLKMPVKSAYVWFDENVIETVLYNLLSNAFKFTSSKGKIQLKIEFLDEMKNVVLPNQAIEKYCRIKISDTGTGIPKEKLQIIFNRFYQIELHGEQNRGTGIGLALCKNLIDLHRGNIEVESEENIGTTITVTIPVHNSFFNEDEFDNYIIDVDDKQQIHEFIDEEYEIIITDADFSALKFNEPEIPDAPKILIIEDDTEMVRYIGKLLEKKYRILISNNGIKGLELVLNEEPDLVISDIMMPGKDGFDLCEKIKSDIRISHIPVILLTALTSIDDRIKGISTGADDYISKPFHPKHFIIRIDKLIEQRQQLRKHFMNEFRLLEDFSNLPSIDEQFMKKILDFIHENMSETDLNVERISIELGISSTHLYRKIKALTGLSTNELIRKIRLKKAAGLLLAKQGSISQIMYDIGFSNQSYFAKCFQNEYGLAPKEYISANERKKASKKS
jgi:signal transduction histidine kinase/ligand-binding sensor domain-containing protein/DNA-binding response OmpR family regulator